jgi:two-component system, NtrC family, sensor kinase
MTGESVRVSGDRNSSAERPRLLTLRPSIGRRLAFNMTVAGVAFILVCVSAIRGIERLCIGGPLYASLSLSHELIADVLPPPAYLVETMLVLHEGSHADRPEQVASVAARLTQLRNEYVRRIDYWRTALPDEPEIREALLTKSLRPAREMFGLIEREYLPALGAGDIERAQRLVRGPISDEYRMHRDAIDRVVALNVARYEKLRDGAHAQSVRVRYSLMVAMIACLLGVGYLATTFSRKLLRRMGSLRDAMCSYANGDNNARSPVEGHDELTAVCRSYNRMADDISQRTAELSATISEMVRIQQEKNELNRQMVVTARQAGMADIAIAVLHNVGNVLNCVNISAGVLLEKLNGSKGVRVQDVAQLLADNEANLPGFFASDERGKRLPGYLVKLADSLTSERKAMTREVRELIENVTNIKQIIAQQQSLSKLGGLIEIFPLAKVVEDAEKFLRSTTLKREVHVTLALDTVEPILIDRQKVLQIVVNLIKNAIEAVEGINDHPRAVGVSLRDNGSGQQAIVVRDNGCGIPPERLKKMFTHGFTTKKTGHGFGLHSCVNLAREMGGDLTVASDGEGLGASFTLTLPAKVAEPDDIRATARSAQPVPV